MVLRSKPSVVLTHYFDHINENLPKKEGPVYGPVFKVFEFR